MLLNQSKDCGVFWCVYIASNINTAIVDIIVRRKVRIRHSPKSMLKFVSIVIWGLRNILFDIDTKLDVCMVLLNTRLRNILFNIDTKNIK